MTTYVAISAVLGFLAGVGVGYLLRDLYLKRKAGTMPDDDQQPSRIRRVLSARCLGLALVTIALLSNAAVGFLHIGTRVAIEENAARDEARLACQEAYNRELGEALSDRDRVIRGTADNEIALWQEYLRLNELALEARDAGDEERLRRLNEEFTTTVEEWVDGLLATQETRSDNPYPDPERCHDQEVENR